MGAVDYVSLDGATPQGCKRLLAVSRSGVVAAVDAEKGEIGTSVRELYSLGIFNCLRLIAWRHVYENEESGVIDSVLRSKWGLVIVSGGGRLLRSWDVSSGSLRWESLTGLDGRGEEELTSYSLTSDWKPGAVLTTVVGASAGEIVSHNISTLYNINRAGVLWVYTRSKSSELSNCSV